MNFREALIEEGNRVREMLSQYQEQFGKVSREVVVQGRYIQALNGVLKYHGQPVIEVGDSEPERAESQKKGA